MYYMDYRFFLRGLLNIFTNPKNNWISIIDNNTPVRVIRNSFLLPLAFIVTLSSFLGSLLFINTELSVVYSLLIALKHFILIIIAVYAGALILRETTYPLDLGRDYRTAFVLVVYSITPLLLCQIVSLLLESFLFVNVLGLFGLYVFWSGAEKLLNPPQYKKMPLLIAATITIAGIYIASDLVLSMFIDRFFFSYFG
jgi:hypothetical protein